MISETYSERKTEVFTLKELASNEISEPQKVIINIPGSNKKGPFDIGAIAYLKKRYQSSKASKGGAPYLVVEDSLLEHRCEFLRKFIDNVIASGYAGNSALGVISKLRTAFSRIDRYEGSESFLETREKTQDFYKKIIADMKHEIGVNKITPRSAQVFQAQIVQIISIAYGSSVADYISKNAIKFSGQVEKTLPREMSELRYAASVYEALAVRLTEFLLENKPFPFLLEMPDYETYLFPYSSHRVTPYCHRPAKAYNYEQGRVATEEEFFAKTPNRKESVLREDLKKVYRNLNIANADPRSKSRRALAATAMQSFQMLFMMLTGSYISEMSKIEFDGSFKISKSITNKSFRVVKLRAAGRVLQYELAARGVRILRAYMRLREWVLAGREMKYLFFGLKVKSWDAVKVRDENIRSFQDKKIIGIFMPLDFVRLTPRQFRKTKSIFLHEEPSVEKETVGMVMNHSVATNENHYMEVSPEKSRKEFSMFWQAVNEAAENIRVVNIVDYAGHIKIASGHCDDYFNPELAIDSPPITPDCKTQYGCLFCSHYICHANDEEDVHKLFSLLYIVIGVMNGVSEAGKARELFSTLEARVRKILFQIKVKSDAGRKNIEIYGRRVFELGELTPYWENRLRRYEKLGLVFIEKEEVFVL